MPYKIGEVLKENDIINENDIEKIINYQKETGFAFGDCLMHFNMCTPEEKNYAFSKYYNTKKLYQKKGLSLKIISGLLNRLIKYKFNFFAIIFTSLISSFFSVSIILPIVTGYYINIIIPIKSVFLVKKFFIISLAALLIGLFFSWISEYLINVLSIRIGKNLLKDSYQKITKISYPIFLKFEKGDLLSRIIDNTENISININNLLTISFQNVFLFIITISILIYIDVWLTFICLSVIFFLCYIPARINKKANSFLYQIPLKIGKISSLLKEIFSAAKFLKLSNKFKNFSNNFENNLNSYYESDFNKNIRWNFAFSFKTLLNTVLLVSILVVGGKLNIHNKISLGSLITFYLIVSQIISRIDLFLGQYNMLQDLKANWKRLDDVFVLPELDDYDFLHNSSRITGDEILVENVDFKYNINDKSVFEKLNIKLVKNKNYIIIGKSGIGKSTLLKLFCKLYVPFNGNIYFDNISSKTIPSSEVWSKVGYLEQEPFIFEGETIFENIAFGVRGSGIEVNKNDVYDAAKKAKIYNYIMNLPNGFDTIIGEKNNSMSGGEKQRICLARILLKNTPILIFDEPTSAIDPENSKLLLELITTEIKDKIIILSTHKVDFLKNIDNLIYFNEAGINMTENKKEIKKIINKFNFNQE